MERGEIAEQYTPASQYSPPPTAAALHSSGPCYAPKDYNMATMTTLAAGCWLLVSLAPLKLTRRHHFNEYQVNEYFIEITQRCRYAVAGAVACIHLLAAPELS